MESVGPPAAPLTVKYDGFFYEVEPGQRLPFGRGQDCPLRVGRKSDGDYDNQVARDAGYFDSEGSLWFVWATGNDLELHDDLGGVRSVLCGRTTAIDRPRIIVTIHGAQPHALDVRYPEAALPSAVSHLPRRYDEDPTHRDRHENPRPSARQKVVYVAKLSPMLDDGGPRSLRATAALLGATDVSYTYSAVKNLWSVWVKKCVDAGFLGLTRATGLVGLSSDQAMFAELYRRKLLTAEDLKLLPGRDTDP